MIWSMKRREITSVALAAIQAVDLAVTSTSPAYGPAHLDHLGVPAWLRPGLPVVKGAAVIALLVSARRTRVRSFVAALLVSYYAAAVEFHRRSGDAAPDMAPAAACAVLAASIL
jgi:hypothetical protein